VFVCLSTQVKARRSRDPLVIFFAADQCHIQ
jgi:hypothetical protein